MRRELSLHPEIVRYLPQMFARVQRRTGRQIILSTHSFDLLRDDGIGLDEVLLLRPRAEGTEVRPASAFSEISKLLQGGSTLADAAPAPGALDCAPPPCGGRVSLAQSSAHPNGHSLYSGVCVSQASAATTKPSGH
jgi:hypothetical protein